jgi:hypothetical protein
MQHQRTYLLSYERRRLVEAAILALVLAEDWPWRAGELAQRLRLPVDVIGLGTATLHADGLLVPAPTTSGGSGDRLRASWAAVRGDELAGWCDSNKRRVHLPRSGGAITLH